VISSDCIRKDIEKVSAETQRASGRRPDARLAQVLQNRILVDLVLSDGARHASDSPNPRPLPQTKLTDLRDRAAWSARGFEVREAVHFAIYGDRYRAAPELAVSVPNDHLWWFVSLGDTVLLSDRVTHHFTSVARVDRASERICFLDPWPDDFLLLRGRNTLGIAAQAEGEKGLSVSKNEFLRSVVGLVIFDTSSLISGYLDAFLEQRSNPEMLVGFGYALLKADDDEVAAEAAAVFAEGFRLANTQERGELAELTASQAYLAATCGRFAAQQKRDGKMLRAMESIVSNVSSKRPLQVLELALSSPELCRMGESAGRAGDLATALRVLDLAVGKDVNNERAYASRAVARAHSGDSAGAAADAARALDLNSAAQARLRDERAAIDPRARWELTWKDGQIRDLIGWRIRELATLAKSNCEVGAFEPARVAARELMELEPDRPEHRDRLAAIEQLARSG
jgi:tetratricopeptide (TPR) repeat protein